MSEVKLVKYEAAKVAIAEAKNVDEIRQIVDKATALKLCARVAQDRQLEIDASEIRIRAERRLGEMIRAQKEGEGLNKGTAGMGRPSLGGTHEEPPKNPTPTLSSVGISKKLSSRAQMFAAIPEEDFEETLEEHRQEQQAVTIGTMEKLAKKAHVSHNSGNNEWYTPKEYIAAARAVMGSIDCDPASSEIANKTVGAKKYFTEQQDGTKQKWSGNVWMNPPYAQPEVRIFCECVSDKYDAGEINQAIVLVNNATETAFFQRMMQSATAICFPKSRIRFIDMDGKPGGTPLQGQAILYFGRNIEKFAAQFKSFGGVLKCMSAA